MLAFAQLSTTHNLEWSKLSTDGVASKLVSDIKTHGTVEYINLECAYLDSLPCRKNYVRTNMHTQAFTGAVDLEKWVNYFYFGTTRKGLESPNCSNAFAGRLVELNCNSNLTREFSYSKIWSLFFIVLHFKKGVTNDMETFENLEMWLVTVHIVVCRTYIITHTLSTNHHDIQSWLWYKTIESSSKL